MKKYLQAIRAVRPSFILMLTSALAFNSISTISLLPFIEAIKTAFQI